MDRLRILRTINEKNHLLGLSLDASLLLADAIHAEFTKTRVLYNFDIFEDRVAFARTKPEVMENLPDRKIQAIKNFRQILSDMGPHGYKWSGLREVKDVIDALSPYQSF